MKIAALAVAGLALVRLLFGLGFELVPQEAYYFFWSEHPALSYFDHPPAIAYALWLSAAALGKSVFAIRFTAFALTAGTLLAFAALARRFLPSARRSAALLLFATTPMVTLLTLISTPDVPLVFFWSLALIFLHDAIFAGRRWAWLAGGLSMGLAFDSKYTALFLQIGLAAFLLASRRHRPLLKTPWPYLAVLVAHLAVLPVYIWNWQHEFLSFLFQTKERAIATPPGVTWRFFFGLLGTQTALLLPPLILALAWVIVRRGPGLALNPRRSREKPLFLLCFLAPMAVPLTGLSLAAQVKPNWLYPAYVSGILLAAAVASRRFVRLNLALSAALHAAVAVEVLFYPLPLQTDDTWFGWEALAREVAARHAADPKTFVFAADSYKTTAELSFYLPKGDAVWGENVLGFAALEFDFIPGAPYHLVGQDAIFLDSAPHDLTPDRAAKTPDSLAAHFKSCDQKEPILIRHLGRIVRKFWVFRCEQFLGPYYGQ
jgi:4-amino-4-deoxy-L-arabinose transferase-like glycosyltransferase